MKSGFVTDLDVKLKNDDDSVWIVKSPLIYFSELLGCIISIPQRFETESSVEFHTDLASVPRVPIIYDMWGNRAHREAVLHDYLFRFDSIPVVYWRVANAVFKEAMISTGKPFRIYFWMHMGVVLGSYPSYHKKSVKDKL
jgi:hypothetical protein